MPILKIYLQIEDKPDEIEYLLFMHMAQVLGGGGGYDTKEVF